MRIAYFTHSLGSCWNHGNAHFVRGVMRELAALGHEAVAYAPADGWSRRNLLDEAGPQALARFAYAMPELREELYSPDQDPDSLAGDADVVVVHEWTDPRIVSALGRRRKRGARFTLLFHDTHHRAVSAAEEMQALDLSGYDGVLAFGEALADIYRGWGWGNRVFVWHEAADGRLFHPPRDETRRDRLVFVGNWGDGERTAELDAFLFRPSQAAGWPADIYGVRYPAEARRHLASRGCRYHGWLANLDAPAIYARAGATVHVPRRHYATLLPGIPTIRVFEALACGVPLVCAPWEDAEALFRPGVDYLIARTTHEMTAMLRSLRSDAGLRDALSAAGAAAIRARHSCAHRAVELTNILARLDAARVRVPA